MGASLGLAVKNNGFASIVTGVDQSIANVEKALELGYIDEIADLKGGIENADLIILAIPVDSTEQLLPVILDHVSTQVVADLGSTKGNVLSKIKNHHNRKRFVACHPMAGTEYSGPEAAVEGLFENKVTVICNSEENDPDALQLVKDLFASLKMNWVKMEAKEHDLHAAYVSHISHITSFALANTVLLKEKEDEKIFQLAGGGFESTVRLAKSNPAMWVPIFKQNKVNVLDVLKEHIHQLEIFKDYLERNDFESLKEFIEHANSIQRIIK